jgi:hypothetical protein
MPQQPEPSQREALHNSNAAPRLSGEAQFIRPLGIEDHAASALIPLSFFNFCIRDCFPA